MPDGTDADRRSNGPTYVTYVNDGVNLLNRASRMDETVFTLDVQNPFSYALLRRPAHGGSAALYFDHTFNDQHKPSAAWLFGSADIVMVPKHPSGAELDASALFEIISGTSSPDSVCARRRNGGGSISVLGTWQAAKPTHDQAAMRRIHCDEERQGVKRNAQSQGRSGDLCPGIRP